MALRSSKSASTAPSDSLFQSAFEYAAIGIALVATDGSWLKVNHSLCNIIGYDEAEFLQHSFQDFTHPDDLELDLSYMRKMLAGEIATYQIEKRYFHKLGGIVWVHLSVSLVRNEDGQPQFFISQIQDITSQKESERQLSEAAVAIKDLRKSLIKICAWTKRVQIDGRWITVDDFLRDHLHLQLTHGMSVEGARLFHQES